MAFLEMLKQNKCGQESERWTKKERIQRERERAYMNFGYKPDDGGSGYDDSGVELQPGQTRSGNSARVEKGIEKKWR